MQDLDNTIYIFYLFSPFLTPLTTHKRTSVARQVFFTSIGERSEALFVNEERSDERGDNLNLILEKVFARLVSLLTQV